MLTYKLLQIKI